MGGIFSSNEKDIPLWPSPHVCQEKYINDSDDDSVYRIVRGQINHRVIYDMAYNCIIYENNSDKYYVKLYANKYGISCYHDRDIFRKID